MSTSTVHMTGIRQKNKKGANNWLFNATYTKDDYVFGAQFNGSADAESADNGLKGYGLAALWNRNGAKYSLHADAKDWNVPDTVTVKFDKQVRDGFTCYLQVVADKFYTETLKKQGEGKGKNTFSLGGDFQVNDSSNLKLSVSADNESDGTLRGVYTHKLGENLTGSISYNSSLEKDGGGVFSDGRIGWKLAFA